MKKVLPVLVIVWIACNARAEWRWEHILSDAPWQHSETTEMEAAYDPDSRSILLVTPRKTENWFDYDTWRFDGQRVEYICTARESDIGSCLTTFAPGNLYYDENLSRMALIQHCSSSARSGSEGTTLLLPDEEQCWRCDREIGFYQPAFDTHRKLAVSFLSGDPAFDYYIWEFDGHEIVSHRQKVVVAGQAVYDPDHRVTVVIQALQRVLEWDGQTLTRIHVEPPDDLREGGPAAYHPVLGGIMVLVWEKATLLLKDHQWTPLSGEETPASGPLAFYPPDGHMYLFTRRGEIFKLTDTDERSHDRPFKRP